MKQYFVFSQSKRAVVFEQTERSISTERRYFEPKGRIMVPSRSNPFPIPKESRPVIISRSMNSN